MTEQGGLDALIANLGAGWRRSKFVRPALEELYAAITLPGDVYQGKVDPRSNESLDRTFSLASLVTGGALPLKKPPMSLGAGGGSFTLEYFGTPVRVLQNPTGRQLERFLSRTKYKAARRVVDEDTGDVFIWDAADPTMHALVAKDLGIKSPKMDTLVID